MVVCTFRSCTRANALCRAIADLSHEYSLNRAFPFSMSEARSFSSLTIAAIARSTTSALFGSTRSAASPTISGRLVVLLQSTGHSKAKGHSYELAKSVNYVYLGNSSRMSIWGTRLADAHLAKSSPRRSGAMASRRPLPSMPTWFLLRLETAARHEIWRSCRPPLVIPGLVQGCRAAGPRPRAAKPS
jgi:hypothetical protein